ncbi:MAG: PDZ domain-containing protein, partial [Phycisphaerae bacterium]
MSASRKPPVRSRFARAVLSPLAVAVLLLRTAPAPAADGQAQAAGRVELSPEMRKGLAALGTGQFQEAFNLIHQAAKGALQSGADPRIAHIDRWLADFEKLQNERAARALKDYEQYVAWAREDAEKQRWQSAIRYASMAFNTAVDQDAFRKEEWLRKVVEGAESAAREYEENGQWVKAARIYYRLTDIFPRNKVYKEALQRSQAHLRLDFTYSPDSDWEAAVSNITPDMAKDAFRKIETEYITEPNFKEAAQAALKHLLLMTQEKKIASVFKRMESEEAVQEFRQRVGARLKDVEEADDLTAQDLINHFDRVLRINDETRLFPRTVLIHEFVHGALRPLDPYSDMLWPSDLQEFNKHTQGKFSGVGISIHKDPGEPLRVVSPLEDSPAYNAGIQAGDLITAINGQPSRKLTITKAVREITGPPNTTVTLTIKRPSLDKEFDVTLERKEITIFTIKSFERDEQGRWKYMIDPENKIGYLRMTNFTENTIDELREVIGKLRSEGMRGLIFDLRGNPGGPLKSAVDVSDMFLEGRKKIVATKDRHGKPWEQSSSPDSDGRSGAAPAHFTDFPMIVLVNGSSASASEIVSGALQVHRRALIVGERSFGKGSVQQVLRLNNTNQAYLKLTTAKYYLPNGRCLHREEDATTWGVDPDVEVKLVPKEVVKVLELRMNNDVLKGKNQENFTKDYVKSVTAFRTATRPARGGQATDKEQEDSKDKAGDKEEGDEESLDEEEDEELAESQRPDPNE